jgi:hypothetical protein
LSREVAVAGRPMDKWTIHWVWIRRCEKPGAWEQRGDRRGSKKACMREEGGRKQ